MKRTIVLALGIMLAGSVMAGPTYYEVFAYDNSLMKSPLNTGLFMNAGDVLSVQVDEDDTWAAGTGDRISNADGLYNFPLYTYNGFSFRFGSLVGQVGSGDYFFIGTSFEQSVTDTGELKLMYWDSNYGDNYDSVSALTANITVDPPAAVPAPGALLLGSVGMGFVGFLRRKRSL